MKPLGKLVDIEELRKRSKNYQSQTKKWTTSSTAVCAKCNDTGTINTYRWETSEDYQYNGKLIPFQVAKVENCECHKEKIFAKYNAAVMMSAKDRGHTFESAMIDNENRQWFTYAQNYLENIEDNLQTGTWLYLYGDDDRARKEGKSAYGTGKSFLTHCIANWLTDRKYRAIYVTEDKLFEEIKNTYNRDAEETESSVMWRYENVDILLIDDLFKSKTTDWTEDKLFHLLNNRQVAGKITIANSNYAPNRIEITMPKNGRAIASRILEQAIIIEMIGKDRRREKAKQRMMDFGK